MLTLIAALILAATTETVSDTEVWNEGVDYYSRGDVTNALRVLRPLMVSRDYAGRAAEVVAKLAYAQGDREEAAAAAQIALRSAPGDERAERNFTRAVSGLPELREKAHVDAVLKAAQGQDPAAQLRAGTYEARDLFEAAGSYRTNEAAQAVMLADRYAARAEKLADLWITAREAVTQSVTNQEQAATILQQVDEAEKATKKAAKELGDLDGEAYASLSAVEHDFTRFLKQVVPPPAAIDEDITAESNACTQVAAVNGRPWQNEALDYTRAFRAKFPMWARAYEQQAQADTNKPPFTAEDQAKISALATELEKLQIACQEKPDRAQQEKALDTALQIRELLPKDGKGGGAGQPQAQPQQNQQQNQQDQQKQDQQKQDQQNQGQQDQQQQDQQAGEQQQEPRDQQELEAMLKKAEERNDEHEAEKKARMRKAPLPPNERDW